MTWMLYTDGSCIKRWGGWAAIVEHGSDGYVLRGREQDTTSVRMELWAVIEGLRSIPSGETVAAHFDTTVLFAIREDWLAQRRDPGIALRSRKDFDLWREVKEEFERLEVRLRYIEKREVSRIHQRAHVIAQTEARVAAGYLPRAEAWHPLPPQHRWIIGHYEDGSTVIRQVSPS